MQKIHIIPLCLCVFLAAGCATTETYWGGWSEWGDWKKTAEKKEFYLSIDSFPSSADVYVDDRLVGTTPAEVVFSHPVLRSSRQRVLYKKHQPGLESVITGPMKDVFDVGPYEPPGTKKVDKEEEEMFSDGSAAYELCLKKNGYLPLITSLEIPYSQDSVVFDLKPKPSLKVSKVTVNNKVKLTFLEKLYELFYDNRFSVKCEDYDFEKIISESNLLNEAFNITESSDHDFILKVNLNIERELTSVQARLLNRNNATLITDRFSFPTKNFCDVIKSKLNTLTTNLTNKFLREEKWK